jgi:hypothetical protein
MKNTRIVCLALAMLMLSGCAVGVGTSPESYPGYYANPESNSGYYARSESYPSHYASPSLVVIPGTYVYAAPDIGADIYFHVGYWWRLTDGLWYRSPHYDRGWNRYRGIPVFYQQIDPGWRRHYAKRQWHGHPWKYERIPAHRVQQEWSRWETTRHWEKRNNWGVQGWRSAAHRQHIDTASPSARTSMREPNRHQDYRTDRLRRETVDSKPQRLQHDRAQRDHSIRQPHNARDQRDALGTGPQRGEELRSRPERRQPDSVQRQTREDLTRRDPKNRPPQDDRRWQATPERQAHKEVTRQGPEIRQPQENRRWQAPSERQAREEVTRRSPEIRQPQEDRRWQATPERQARKEMTRQGPEIRQPQDERRWQAPPERNARKEMTRQGPEFRQPQENRRHRQDGKKNPTVLQQPDPELEITQDSSP